MKSVTKYQATDGSLFDTPGECRTHEKKARLNELMILTFKGLDSDLDRMLPTLASKLSSRYMMNRIALSRQGAIVAGK